MADTRWLSAEEQRAWRAYLEANQLLWYVIDSQLQRAEGLGHADYEILVRLSETPQRELRMSELATGLLYSRSRLSHAVARLERAGWVERRECTTDKRGTIASLTEAGFAKLAGAAPEHVETVRNTLVDPLSPEQLRSLQEICTTLGEHLRTSYGMTLS